jgi:NodT family efflux transporter outer membrane factor (OMF) lipoprotein
MTWRGRRLVIMTALVLSTGCAVGPDFRPPVPPAVERYGRAPLRAATESTDIPGGETQRFVQRGDLPSDWWTLFQSPSLNGLVEQALRANPTLVAAQASLRQAMELVAAQRGLFYPGVQAGFAASRQSDSTTLAPVLASNQLNYSLYTTQITVGFIPDVFGGNRRQVEALLGQAEAQRFQREAAYVTLTANVVAAAVQDASVRAQIAASRDMIAIVSESLRLVRRQFDLGAVSGIELSAQEASLAQAQQTLPPLEKQLEQNRNLLAALLGRLPGDAPGETFELAALRLPADLPVGVPSRLVDQRPDVRAAEAQMHAASAQIGVAVANRLPQFLITGGLGGTSTSLARMFANGNPFWSVAGSVAQSIFDGGLLWRRQRAAEAAFEQTAAQYRATVITAFQNVADALYALQADAEALKVAGTAERAAEITLDLTRRQLQLGSVNYLALLSAQQAYQQSVMVRVQAQASRLADTAALFQALGGGWWNRADIARTDGPGAGR